jgi:signal transduction histidine kinase
MLRTLPILEDLKEMMQLITAKVAWLVFGVPLVLLVLLGFAADRTTSSFARSEYWVSHTRQVQTELETLRADMFMAQDARKGYVLAADESSLTAYDEAIQNVPAILAHLRVLLADNPSQIARLDQLEPIMQQKLVVLQRSMALRKSGKADDPQQATLTAENAQFTSQMLALFNELNQGETALLKERVVISAERYQRLRVLLGTALALVVLFLLASFVRLIIELRQRMRAEAAVRRLSSRILQLQDAERRKIARELHDGLGQYLAASKMNVDGVLYDQALSQAHKKALTEASELLEQGISEARTLSYLLHPPLLDEVGFRAAAEWYIQGFSERSKIQVQLNMMPGLESIPKDIELVLFRVLQEALTNIHRHSASPTAEIRIVMIGLQVQMEIEDQGRGIPKALLDDFRRKTGTGVGLAGMRERVHEFQGELEIYSEGRGALLRVAVPMPKTTVATANVSGPPDLQSTLRTQMGAAEESGGGLLFSALPV